ncbi:hypothetical protein SUGI_0945640 [Cryptomeria japonica]|nr:hypothetical protein SUGI_0945640 [Cryptomeria japonica]
MRSIHATKLVQINCICSNRQKQKWAVPKTSYRTQCNAGAAELGGSGIGSFGGMPEQELERENRLKKKKKKEVFIAGVDQDELADPLSLADSDSLFVEFNGVHLHHKLADCSSEISVAGTSNLDNGVNSVQSDIDSSIGIPAILLHGFGASVFSWDRVLKPLARLIGSKVVAFDRPAFGLTSRIELPASANLLSLNPYSIGFSAAAALRFIDLLQSQKAILIGHSAGCLVAANAYFEAPERVAALILVAPAIIAPLVIGKNKNMNRNPKQRNQQDDNFIPEEGANPFRKIKMMLFRLWAVASRMVVNMVQEMKSVANTVYQKILSIILRSSIAVMLVRFIMDKYSREAVRYAWYDKNQVTDQIIHGYTKPLKCKGWEKALIEFTLAMLTDSSSEGKLPLQKQLKDISCPVLIVTGDTDRIVPAWNAERLANAISGAKFEVIKNCGHLPQEEKPEEFLAVIQRFLQWAFNTSEKQVLQIAG